MFNKIASLFAGLLLTISSVGCCGCLGHGYGYGANYGSRGCAPCNNGCAPAGGGYYPPAQGAFYQGMDASQTAFVGGGLSQTAYAPIQTGFAPTQSAYIPTSTAALMPGAIQGPPIYQNAANVPISNLPMY